MQLIIQFDNIITLKFDSAPTLQRLQERFFQFYEQRNIKLHFKDFLVFKVNGNRLNDSQDIVCVETVVRVEIDQQLRGGKGGFGALLRRLAKQAGPKKTTDFGACRDLYGRRIRHVNDEIILQKWKEAKDRGEEFDVNQPTPSGIKLWFMPTPSWSQGFGKKFRMKRSKSKRKTVLCMDWVKAREEQNAPEGAPAWWGCPRGRRCDFAHGEDELIGENKLIFKQQKIQERKDANEKLKSEYLSALFDGEAESDQTAEDKVMAGLQALKRARSDVGTVIETKLPEESSESDDDVTYETIKPVETMFQLLSGDVDIKIDENGYGLLDGRAEFSTVIVGNCRISQPGSYYYEVELLTGGLLQVGFGTLAYNGYVTNGLSVSRLDGRVSHS
jgi:hypothetical protein